jgi:hypothetical protein
VLLQESVYASNAQYLDSKIMDLQRQKMLWESERLRKKLLCQRLQDEFDADVRRIALQKKISKKLSKVGLVGTLELLSEPAKRTSSYPLRSQSSKTVAVTGRSAKSMKDTSSRKEVKGEMQRISRSNKLRIVKEFVANEKTFLAQSNDEDHDGLISPFASMDDADNDNEDGTIATIDGLLAEMTSGRDDPDLRSSRDVINSEEERAGAHEVAYMLVHHIIEDIQDGLFSGTRVAPRTAPIYDMSLTYQEVDVDSISPEAQLLAATSDSRSHVHLVDDMASDDGIAENSANHADKVEEFNIMQAVEDAVLAAVDELEAEEQAKVSAELAILSRSAQGEEALLEQLPDEAIHVPEPPRRLGYDVSVSAYRTMRTGLLGRRQSTPTATTRPASPDEMDNGLGGRDSPVETEISGVVAAVSAPVEAELLAGISPTKDMSAANPVQDGGLLRDAPGSENNSPAASPNSSPKTQHRKRRNSQSLAEFRYSIIAIDPVGVHWTIDKSFAELKVLHKSIQPHYLQVCETKFNELHGIRVEPPPAENDKDAAANDGVGEDDYATSKDKKARNKQANQKSESTNSKISSNEGKDKDEAESANKEPNQDKRTDGKDKEKRKDTNKHKDRGKGKDKKKADGGKMDTPSIPEEETIVEPPIPAAPLPVFNPKDYPLPFPASLTVLYPTLWHHMERAKDIQKFLMIVMGVAEDMAPEGQEILANFLEIVDLMPSYEVPVEVPHAEEVVVEETKEVPQKETPRKKKTSNK